MSNSVPRSKEQLTAFQRWELNSFDEVEKPNAANITAEALRASSETAATQLENLKKKAYDESYAAGLAAGHNAGMQQAQAEINNLQTLMGNLHSALTQIDEQLAQSLLELSLEVAQKMVAGALHVQPEILVKIISTAISNLPHFNQNAHLILNPNDAELVRRQMGDELAHAGWKIFTDPKIECGGCRVETAHSNIDATNPARWHNIVDSIGQDTSWLKTAN
ncbi:MAG: flagellar assembly protein FliH [Nitrosomonadales bacterium]|jgi:flagellar assembly protein FliH